MPIWCWVGRGRDADGDIMVGPFPMDEGLLIPELVLCGVEVVQPGQRFDPSGMTIKDSTGYIYTHNTMNNVVWLCA